MEYEAVIGLEVHAQLLTESKLFCRCSAAYGAEPNTAVCPVCLGLPGALPVINGRAVEMAVLAAKALGAEIHPHSIFARKNYFYPDLPKGYQISQYDRPLAGGGHVRLDPEDDTKTVRLIRVHLEEDAGKSLHRDQGTMIDFNRCGVPLIEIVSEPDIRTPEHAHRYLTELRKTLMYIEVCDGNMEEGSLRCDANVSVRRRGETRLGTKTEIKNLNSFRGVEKGLEAAIERQVKVLESGGEVVQETMLWDARSQVLTVMRSKEEAHDYRYFPDPDLPALHIDPILVDAVHGKIPELPEEKLVRFMGEYDLRLYDAEILTSSRPLADYFESCARRSGSAKAAGNWIMTELLREVGEDEVSTGEFPVSPEDLADLLILISDGRISGKMAKEVFADMVESGTGPHGILESRGLVQVTDEVVLTRVAQTVLEDNPDAVKSFVGGKDRALIFLVGQLMKETRGRANPDLANKILRKLLE